MEHNHSKTAQTRREAEAFKANGCLACSHRLDVVREKNKASKAKNKAARKTNGGKLPEDVLLARRAKRMKGL